MRGRGFRRRCDAAIQGYGPEIYGFLVGLHASETEADELFSTVSEACGGVAEVRLGSTLRTWAYTIRATPRFGRRKVAQRDEGAAADGERGRALAARSGRGRRRSAHGPQGRAEALRDALEPEDRMLLVLRVTGISRGASSRA